MLWVPDLPHLVQAKRKLTRPISPSKGNITCIDSRSVLSALTILTLDVLSGSWSIRQQLPSSATTSASSCSIHLVESKADCPGLGVTTFFFSGIQTIRSSYGRSLWPKQKSCLWAYGKVCRGTMDVRDSGVFSSMDCIKAGEHITYIDKAKWLVQQLRIVRLADSPYQCVKSELLCWCHPSVLHWAWQRWLSVPHSAIYTCVLVLG